MYLRIQNLWLHDSLCLHLVELKLIGRNCQMQLIEHVEARRAQYYNYYTGKKWGAAESYDLCMDASLLGLEETEKLIADFIRKRFGL